MATTLPGKIKSHSSETEDSDPQIEEGRIVIRRLHRLHRFRDTRQKRFLDRMTGYDRIKIKSCSSCNPV
jgi:hypothetical protein